MEQMNEPNPSTLEQPTEVIEPETERPQEGVKQLCINALKKVIPGTRGEHDIADVEMPALNRPLTRRETHRQSVREFKQRKNHSKVAAQYHHRRNLRSTHGRSPGNKDRHPGRTERAESRYQIIVDNLSDAVDVDRFTAAEQQYAGQKVETSARDWLKKAQAAAEADNKTKK